MDGQNPIKTHAERLASKARAKALTPAAEEQAPAAPAAPVAEESLPVAPDAPVVPDVPAEPKFKAGDRVKSKDPARMSGTVKGAPMAACPDYEIETADGGTYIESESQLEPALEDEPAQEDEMITDETVAPAALAQSVGLNVGATLGECSAAALATRAELDRERSEARNAACVAAGMHADLVDVLSPTIARGEGQTWDQAVAAHKASKPSAYAKPEAPAAAAPAKPEPAKAQTPPRQPVPAGMAAGEQTSAPNVGAAGGPVSFNLGVSVRPALG